MSDSKNSKNQFEDSRWVRPESFNENSWHENMDQWKDGLDEASEAPLEIQQAIQDQKDQMKKNEEDQSHLSWSEQQKQWKGRLPGIEMDEDGDLPEKKENAFVKNVKKWQINGWIFLMKLLMVACIGVLVYVFFIESEEDEVKDPWKHGIAPLMWCPSKSGGLIVNVEKQASQDKNEVLNEWEYLVWLNDKHEVLKALPIQGEDLKEWKHQKTNMQTLQKESFMADLCHDEGAAGVGQWDIQNERAGNLSAIDKISEHDKEGLKLSVMASWNERRKLARKEMLQKMMNQQASEVERLREKANPSEK